MIITDRVVLLINIVHYNLDYNIIVKLVNIYGKKYHLFLINSISIVGG